MNIDPLPRTSYGAAVSTDSAVAEFFRRVFLWMTVGLAVTGGVAFWVASSARLIEIFLTGPIFWVVLLAPLGIVFAMSALEGKLSALAATGMFLLYSAVNGLTFSMIFLIYTGSSIARVFFITAGMFGALALYGFVTRRDLSGMGQLFFMGVVGIIIASLVNIFLASDALSWAISVVGVVVFAGLTAYDTQRLRAYAIENAVGIGSEGSRKVAIFGALSLYLNFINMFMFMLRLFGSRRD
jgi:FtsH-binding integral membrane protein